LLLNLNECNPAAFGYPTEQQQQGQQLPSAGQAGGTGLCRASNDNKNRAKRKRPQRATHHTSKTNNKIDPIPIESNPRKIWGLAETTFRSWSLPCRRQRQPAKWWMGGGGGR